jgi:hypothetical protein
VCYTTDTHVSRHVNSENQLDHLDLVAFVKVGMQNFWGNCSVIRLAVTFINFGSDIHFQVVTEQSSNVQHGLCIEAMAGALDSGSVNLELVEGLVDELNQIGVTGVQSTLG